MATQQRTCLKCGQGFESAGPGHRICRRCARVNARTPITEHQLQKQRGVQRRNGELVSDPARDALARGQAHS